MFITPAFFVLFFFNKCDLNSLSLVLLALTLFVLFLTLLHSLLFDVLVEAELFGSELGGWLTLLLVNFLLEFLMIESLEHPFFVH